MQRCQPGYVGGTAQPLDVRMTADDTAGRAWGIEQNGIVLSAVPPLGRLCRIALHQFGIQAKSLKILCDAIQSLGAYANSLQDVIGGIRLAPKEVSVEIISSLQDLPVVPQRQPSSDRCPLQ